MKLLLFLLVLTLGHEATSTHLETCELYKIEQLLDAKVQEAIEKLTTTITTTMEQLIRPLEYQINHHFPPPGPLENSRQHPAISCNDLYWNYPQTPSGYYWIRRSGKPAVRVYCSMNRTCGDEKGGWMRVANIDMRDTNQSCPSGLTFISSPKRLCTTVANHCASSNFSTQGIQYSHVCGKIVSYQYRYPIAFYNFRYPIDDAYVNGVSLTQGQSPRKHIWTFAAARDESRRRVHSPSFKCPCIWSGAEVPSYVGNDYFCDTALRNSSSQNNGMNTIDPLWDGKGCTTSTCCSFNSPPWFVKELPSPTADDIEMRLCSYNSNTTPIETVEIYVQ